jgi:hypothetical protein
VPYSGDFGKQRRTRNAGYLILFAGELLFYNFEGTTQNKHKIWKGVKENTLKLHAMLLL